jgi:hypothetical protein
MLAIAMYANFAPRNLDSAAQMVGAAPGEITSTAYELH